MDETVDEMKKKTLALRGGSNEATGPPVKLNEFVSSLGVSLWDAVTR